MNISGQIYVQWMLNSIVKYYYIALVDTRSVYVWNTQSKIQNTKILKVKFRQNQRTSKTED